jgi:hypothetical protein
VYTTAPQQWVKNITDKYGKQMRILYRTNVPGELQEKKEINGKF